MVPYITNQWQVVQQQQSHQMELEIKTGLLDEIGESIGALLAAREKMELYKEGIALFSNDTLALYQDQFSNWKAFGVLTGSKLAAYFPDSPIGLKWDRFENLTSSFYALAGLTPDYRYRPMHEIQQLIAADSKTGNSILGELSGLNTTDSDYYKARKILERYIHDQSREIMNDIVRTNIQF